MTGRTAAGGEERRRHIGDVVGAVARQMLLDRGALRIALLDDDSPEAALAAEWLTGALPPGSLVRIRQPHAELEPLLRSAEGSDRLRAEAVRFAARMVDDAVVANPVNRTAMLLGGDPPPEPFLPLADLFASQVAAITGRWSAPAPVAALAERAGGIEELDRSLRALLDGRDPAALDTLPPGVGDAVRAALGRGRAGRRAPHVVPKIAYRTLGVDLFQ